MSTEQPAPMLDDLARMQAVDTKNMLRLINELPEQCETALGIGRSFIPEPLVEAPNLVIISGVGDSGIAVDMAVSVVGDYVDVPVVSNRGGQLPKSVGATSLVLVVDYDGKSQSGLRIYKEARTRGARVVCITSGGKLREAASRDGVRIVKIPPGQPARSAIGYLFMPVLALMEQFGLAQGLLEKLSYGIMHMKNVREAFRFETATARNVAKQIALALKDKLVIVYGAQDYRAAVAVRWKSQVNTNSKVPAFASYFPDVAQGELSGWERSIGDADGIGFIFLKDPQDRTEVTELMGIAERVMDGFSIVEAQMKGGTAIERLLYGVYLADYVSCYLALLNEVNPTPTEFISRVESLLAGEVAPSEPAQPTQPTPEEA